MPESIVKRLFVFDKEDTPIYKYNSMYHEAHWVIKSQHALKVISHRIGYDISRKFQDNIVFMEDGNNNNININEENGGPDKLVVSHLDPKFILLKDFNLMVVPNNIIVLVVYRFNLVTPHEYKDEDFETYYKLPLLTNFS